MFTLKRDNQIKSIVLGIFTVCCVLSSNLLADDTELYVTSGGARSDHRPQILIIFDNSNSMSTNVQNEKTFFNPTHTLASGSKIFFSLTTSVPEATSDQFFLNEKNGCQTSIQYLNGYGLFTGYLRDYQFIGQTGAWREMTGSNNDTITQVDCFEDISEKDTRNNSFADGFPVDHLGSPDSLTSYSYTSGTDNSVLETAYQKALLTNFGVGKPVNLYTEEYVKWYHNNEIPTDSYQRIEIATKAIENVIVTTPGADIGFAIFNHKDVNGGRIISGIKKTTVETKDALLTVIPQLNTEPSTPLCETLYEAYRYFSGQSIDYGNATNEAPSYDESIVVGGIYDSPLKDCQKNINVILVTDGYPQNDVDADNAVLALPDIDPNPFLIVERSNRPSLLPNLAEWLANNDINPNVIGEQKVITSTIGFSEGAVGAAGILAETAVRGGGTYYSASNTSELQTAISSLVNVALSNGNTFTSPAIASNNFDRTKTLDSVYYAMFNPNKGPRWSGNLKKFRVTGRGTVVDKNNESALAPNGTIKSSACSIWTSDSVCSGSGGDGNDVAIGGAAQKVREKAANPTGRKLLMNFSSGMKALTQGNAQTQANTSAALATYMRTDQAQLNNVFAWLEGKDVDNDDGDNSTTDIRSDIIGDPLHSRPLAINYSTSTTATDVRILMGTNHGFMHMFKDTGANIEETWAFMPYELLPNVAELRSNTPSGVHSVYGLDSPPVAYVERNGATVTKALVFFGMRRGGNSYYALDITTPDTPVFLWRKDSSDWGSELGQTWSEPVITKIPGHDGPVMIVGAGYAPETKDLPTAGEADIKGRGIYIVDALTGNFIHHFGRGAAASRTNILTIEDSIPSSVTILDSDADGVTDRIYASDTGGNIWRMDLPSSVKSTWSAFKFASLGGTDVAIDRRFYSEPAVAQTVIKNTINIAAAGAVSPQFVEQNIPYDAVVIGSGVRPKPKDTQRTDMFFTLQDRNIATQTFGSTNTPATLVLDDLYPITAGAPDTNTERDAFSAKRGWYYQFGSTGEKSLSAATIIDGKVFFSSYVPDTVTNVEQCTVNGEGRVYALDLHFGARSFYQNQAAYRTVVGIPDTPQVIVPGNTFDPNDPYNPDGLNKYIIGQPESVGEVQRVKSYYYYVEEGN